MLSIQERKLALLLQTRKLQNELDNLNREESGATWLNTPAGYKTSIILTDMEANPGDSRKQK